MSIDDENTASVFLTEPTGQAELSFTDCHELYCGSIARLFKAKRHGRWHVLKALTDDKARQSVYRQLLQKELNILMQMQHPGVVQVYGMEEVNGIGTCIVMEYIDGENLQQMLDSGEPMPIEKRRRIADEVIDALAYVHSLGIVHRDLKPDNIMVTRNGHYAKLVDFGMADTDRHTILKQPAGTLRYMAPEQAEQSVADVRNDIYSLGVIMQQLQLGSIYQRVVERCLKPIDLRYDNIEDLQADIRRLRARRRQRHVALLAAVAVLAVLVIGWQAWRLQQMTEDRSEILANIDSMHLTLSDYRAESASDRQREDEARKAMSQQMEKSLETLSDSIRRLTADNEQLRKEIDRTDQAKRQAVAALHAEISRSGIDHHLDTLSHWSYHLPDLSNRMTGVSRFIYRYTDDMASHYKPHECKVARQAMLDEWSAWSKSVTTRANSIRSKMPKPLSETVLSKKNKIPARDL